MTLSTRGRTPAFADIRQVAVLVVASDAPVRVKRLTDVEYVCDGIADNAQIQQAINYVWREGGGQVVLSPGTFVTAANITWRSNVDVIGSGRGTIVDFSALTSGFAITGTGVTQAGIYRIQWKGTTTGTASAISLSANCQYVQIAGNYFNTGYYGVFGDAGGRNITIHHNDFATLRARGVELYNSSNATTFTQCVIGPNTGNAITDSFILLNGYCSYNTVKGNILNNSSLGTGTTAGACVHLDTQCTFNTVTGNVANQCQDGFSCEDSSDFNTFAGNVARLCDGNGMDIADSRHNTVMGNVFYGNCRVESSAAGLLLENATYNTIQGNQCIDLESAPTQVYGIREITGSDYNTITGNELAGNTTGGVLTIGANSVVRGNRGHVTENSGTATIASGATSVVVTHGLAATPSLDDIVLMPTENSTNDPGPLYVTTITATQFTANCRADPGASNLDLAWRAVVL